MNSEILIIIGYGISFVALVLCGFSVYKELFKHSTFILFAVCILALALTTYINSDYVNIQKIGDQSTLGQFGDFVGGILNPIFGFITIIILIQTLSNESEKSKEDRKNTIETLHQKKIEKLMLAIRNSKEYLYEDLSNKKLFSVSKLGNKKESFFDYYFNEPNKSIATRRHEELKAIQQICHLAAKNQAEPNGEAIEKELAINSINIYQAVAYRFDIEHICHCYLNLIENEHSGILRHQISIEYSKFMGKMFTYYLITVEDLNEAEENARTLNKDYDRKSL